MLVEGPPNRVCGPGSRSPGIIPGGMPQPAPPTPRAGAGCQPPVSEPIPPSSSILRRSAASTVSVGLSVTWTSGISCPFSINARPWLAFAYVGRAARCSASHCSLIHPRSEPCLPRDMLSVESIAAAVIAMRTRMLTICSVHDASPAFVPFPAVLRLRACEMLVHRTHVSAGTALRQAGTRLAFWDLRDERFCRE
jgi:hypothetical protein